MLDDLGNYSNLPAVQSGGVPANPFGETQTRSLVDISFLFAEGVRQGVEALLPLQVDDSETHAALSSQSSSLASIDYKLDIIISRMAELPGTYAKPEVPVDSGKKGYGNSGSVKSKTPEEETYELTVAARRQELKNAQFEERALRHAEQQSKNLYEAFNSKIDEATNVLKNPFSLLGYGLERLLKRDKTKGKASTVKSRYRQKLKGTSGSGSSTTSGSVDDTDVIDTVLDPLEEEAPDTVSYEEVVADTVQGTDTLEGFSWEVSDAPEPASVSPFLALTAPAETATVVGENDAQNELMASQLQANQLVADTFQEPEDSEFVEAIGGATTGGMFEEADTGLAAALALAGGALGASLALALSPLFNGIAYAITRTTDFLTDTLYHDIMLPMFQDVIKPFGELMLEIFQRIKDPFIAMVSVTFLSIAKVVESIGTSIALIQEALGTAFATLIEDASSLMHAMTGKFLDFVEDPVGQIKEIVEGMSEIFSVAFNSIVKPLGEELGLAMKRVFPEWLGGYSKEQKQAMNQAEVDAFIASKTGSIVSSGVSEITASTVNVYAASPDAFNTVESSTSSESTDSSRTATVNIYQMPVPAITRPGESL